MSNQPSAEHVQSVFMKAVADLLHLRLVTGERALQRALELGAANKRPITIAEPGSISTMIAIVPEDLEITRQLLVEEARKQRLMLHIEIRAGRIWWDCDPEDAPWGTGRTWSPVDLIEEMAIAASVRTPKH